MGSETINGSGVRHATRNLRLADRLLRGAVAVGLLAMATFALTRSSSAFALVCVALLAVVSLGLLATGVIGYCPVRARVMAGELEARRTRRRNDERPVPRAAP